MAEGAAAGRRLRMRDFHPLGDLLTERSQIRNRGLHPHPPAHLDKLPALRIEPRIELRRHQRHHALRHHALRRGCW